MTSLPRQFNRPTRPMDQPEYRNAFHTQVRRIEDQLMGALAETHRALALDETVAGLGEGMCGNIDMMVFEAHNLAKSFRGLKRLVTYPLRRTILAVFRLPQGISTAGRRV